MANLLATAVNNAPLHFMRIGRENVQLLGIEIKAFFDATFAKILFKRMVFFASKNLDFILK